MGHEFYREDIGGVAGGHGGIQGERQRRRVRLIRVNVQMLIVRSRRQQSPGTGPTIERIMLAVEFMSA